MRPKRAKTAREKDCIVSRLSKSSRSPHSQPKEKKRTCFSPSLSSAAPAPRRVRGGISRKRRKGKRKRQVKESRERKREEGENLGEISLSFFFFGEE